MMRFAAAARRCCAIGSGWRCRSRIRDCDLRFRRTARGVQTRTTFEKGFSHSMTLRSTRLVAFALLLILLSPVAGAAKRRHRKSRARRRAAPAVPADAASGNTLAERINSLMNGRVANSSSASLQVAEVDSGTIVAE